MFTVPNVIGHNGTRRWMEPFLDRGVRCRVDEVMAMMIMMMVMAMMVMMMFMLKDILDED